MNKRLLIVDDHLVVIQGLTKLLNLEAGLEVCSHATSAAQGLAMARSLQPDLMLLDLSLGSSSGLDLIKDLKSFLPNLPVLVLSMHDEIIYAERTLRSGARGYIMKSEPFEHMLKAIHKLLDGEIYVSEAVNSRTLHRLAGSKFSGGTQQQGGLDALSDRELQVLEHIGQGKGTRAIAKTLHISVKTVETHRANLKKKLQLPDAPALLRFAIERDRYGDQQKSDLRETGADSPPSMDAPYEAHGTQG